MRCQNNAASLLGDSCQHIPEVAASGGIHASGWLILGSDMGCVFECMHVCAHDYMRGGAITESHLIYIFMNEDMLCQHMHIPHEAYCNASLPKIRKSNDMMSNLVTCISSAYQEDDWRVPNKSNSCAQLPLVTTTAAEKTKHHIHLTRSVRTTIGTPVPLPVSATAFVCMLAEVQSGDFSLHHILDLTLWDPSEAGKHCEEFTASQTLNQRIKLARSQGTSNNMSFVDRLDRGMRYVSLKLMSRF